MPRPSPADIHNLYFYVKSQRFFEKISYSNKLSLSYLIIVKFFKPADTISIS
jgi:hypothetical protein